MTPTSTQIINKVKDAGVVGAGGAGFPAYIKINSKVKTLIANAASCEPLVTSDFALINIDPEKLLKSMTLVMDVTSSEEGIIAIKRKHKSIIKTIEKELSKYKDKRLRLHLLDDFYPAGDEFVLVYEVTQKIIPERALPLEVGCLVQNVTTLIQIFEACENKPVTGRFVTITGEVEKPQDVFLPLGFSFKEAISIAGGPTCENIRVIHGGPMMGKLVENIESETVLKTTSMILVLPEEHILIQKRLQPISNTLKMAKSVCCQCSMCSDLCPRGLIGHPLNPHKIMRTIAYNLSEPAENVTSSFLCSECGLCSSYSCSMGLIPHRVNIEIKSALTKNKFKFERLLKDYNVDNEIRDSRKVPTYRLMSRLDLTKYKIDNLPVRSNNIKPASVSINLQQHIGAKSKPKVKVGDIVNKGDLIADIPDNKLGANIHASINGEIKEINDNEIVIKG
ncbi:MAG: 4Fe-4S dicluster domain-containing protein [Cyanobacteriota bacterium]